MTPFQKILFPTDFSSGAERALAWALALADGYDAELHLFHGVVLGGILDEEAHARLDGLESLAGKLDAIASRRIDALAPERKLKRVTRHGLAAAGLIRDYAGEQQIDLIVMGTHGRRGPAHVLLGSVAEEVVRTAACPVLTVRERESKPEPSAIETILVPLDLSQNSTGALVHAKSLAATYGAKLQLLHVVPRPTYPSFYALKQSYFLSMLADIEKEAKEAMADALDEAAGPDVPFATFVAEGDVVPSVLDFADEHGSDLLILSSHGLTGLKRLLLGSVAEKLVRRAEIPALTVNVFE